MYQGSVSITRAKSNVQILGAFTLMGVKSLFWVILGLAILIFVEAYIRNNLSWLPPLSADDKEFNIEQLRLYAQLLTAIFSIYFATIGIILSTGYTRFRRDIIKMLVNEQVGSGYSSVLVFSVMFCLAATTLPLVGFEPGIFVYSSGTILSLLSAVALFPLGKRLFDFFDLNSLARTEILPKITRHIKGATNRRNSNSLANHHSKAARLALEQLSYIDDRVKADKEGLEDNLPVLTDRYTNLLIDYLQRKHTIDQNSYWYPRRRKHKQWFFADETATSAALQTSSQQPLVEETPDYQWFENEIVNRLAGHIELAFQVKDFDLALQLISRFSTRIAAYAKQFQFEIGMQELKRYKEVIEQTFASSKPVAGVESVKVQIALADTWAALGSSLCLETLRRMMTFEKELEMFFEKNEWTETSLRHLPFLWQLEFVFIVERIEFEQVIEGHRLSKPKYVQQLAVQRLLLQYAKVLPKVCDFYQAVLPDFVDSLSKLEMSASATQVVLASLHSHWKMPRWFDEVAQLLNRYSRYEHYTEEYYKLPKIEIAEMTEQLVAMRDDAIGMLSEGTMIKHIFESKHDDDLPDHFGQVYFELAEACISALEENDVGKLDKILPTFLSLAVLAADSKFLNPSLDVNEETRINLISTVINDLASVLGFAILYGAYFDNNKLSKSALDRFDALIEHATDKQLYLKRMVFFSNPHGSIMSASPRGMIRNKWRMSFERRVRDDGFGGQMGMGQGKLHPNKVVRAFLKTLSDASHLFLAKQVVPQLERDSIDFEIDRHITELARRLDAENENEDFQS
jgi:hypothetical protein